MGVFIWQSTAMKKRGFTLAELMIAVGIMAMLTIAGFVAMQNQTQRARDQRRESDLEQIRQALEQFRLTSADRIYPTPTPGEPHIVLSTTLRNFLSEIPHDPLESTHYRYYYEPQNAGQGYELCARLETGGAGVAGTCGNLVCGQTSGENCNVVLNQP